MFELKRWLRILAPLAVVCGALCAASCGGNNNSSPASSSTIGPTQGYSITLTTSGGAIPLPVVSGGNSVTLTYAGSAVALPSPFPTSGVLLTTTTAISAPTNGPAPTSIKRVPLSKTNATGVLYVTFDIANDLPANIFSGETLNLGTATPTNVPYFVELDDITSSPGTFINTFAGSAVANGQVQFTNANGFIPTLDLSTQKFSATHTYELQFYYLGTGTPPSPTPTPSISPLPTPTPVVVSTTVPLGAPQSVVLPVTNGGFVGTVTLPATAGGSSLMISATSGLPIGVSAVGTSNNAYPFYTFGFAATGAVGAQSPALSLQLPSNFSATSQLLAALCSDAASCASPTLESEMPTQGSTTTNGGTVVSLSFAPGAFKSFTQFSTTQQYVIFYSNRATPPGNSVTGTIPAGGAGTFTIPGITPNISNSGGGQLSSVVTLGGTSATTTATVSAQTGLFSGIGAIIPNKQTVFYALSVTATPTVTLAGSALNCGSAPCVLVTLPSQTTMAAAGATYYVEQCSATACPASGTTASMLTLSGSTMAGGTLAVSSTQIGTVAGLSSTTPLYLVFYYQ